MTLGISIRKFAELDGCSEGLVRRGIKEKRLHTLSDGTLDPALARTAWRQGNISNAKSAPTGAYSGAHCTHARDASELFDDDATAVEAAERILSKSGAKWDYAEALRVKENYLALLRQLEFEQKSGAVIELELAQQVLFEASRNARDAWLNWPVKFGPEIAADLSLDADKVVEILNGYVYKQLVQLGEPQPDFLSL